MAIVVGSTFLGFLGIGAILPVMAPHVRHDLGQNDVVLGFAIGIFSIVALAARLLSGPITDQRGRKYSYRAGLILCSLAGVSYLLPLGISAVFLGRILQGTGEAFLFTGAAAWIVELGGDGRQARSLGWLSSGIWGGITMGPVIGQFLGSYTAAAWMLALTPLPAIAALSFVPEHYTPPPPREGPAAWIPRGAVMPGLVLGFVNVHYPAIAGFLVLHLADRGNNVGGQAIALYAGMILASRFFLGGLPDRLSPMITFYAGTGLMMAGLLLTAATPPAPWALAAAAMIGFGFSFPWPSIAATVLKRADPAERAATLGAVSAFVDAFVGVAALLTGKVAKSYGYPSIYVLATASVAISSVLAYGYLRRPEVEAEGVSAGDGYQGASACNENG